MGLVPHRAAKDASLRSRSGLSPAATSSAAAVSAPMPQAPSSAGLARSHRRRSSASRCLICAVRAWWRRARQRSARLAAERTRSPCVSGRIRAQAATVRAVFSARRRSLTGSGAGHDDSVDLVGGDGAGLDRGAARHTQGPDRLDASVGALGHHCGTAVERGPCRWLRVDGVGLAAAAAHLAVRAVRIDDVDAGSREVPGEARAVGAGSLHADALDAAVAAEPSQQRRAAGGVRVERGAAQDPCGAVEDGGDMGVVVGAGPRRIRRGGPVS